MSAGSERTLFGDLMIIAFLATQAADGVFTYVGISTMGVWVEGNPMVSTLMTVFGQAAALTIVKLLSSSLGVMLHVTGVHRVVALLTCLYLAAAIVPWTALLFF
jgi:hypothetical protein